VHPSQGVVWIEGVDGVSWCGIDMNDRRFSAADWTFALALDTTTESITIPIASFIQFRLVVLHIE
jgi:hypothetical protein